MDIQMPIMDGVEATKIVRRRNLTQPNGFYLPIIAVTAHVYPEEKQHFLGTNYFNIYESLLASLTYNILLFLQTLAWTPSSQSLSQG